MHHIVILKRISDVNCFILELNFVTLATIANVYILITAEKRISVECMRVQNETANLYKEITFTTVQKEIKVTSGF